MSQIIITTSDLHSFLDRIKSAPFITIDTEFMRERTYYPELCLIQICDDQNNAAAIDPLANGIDLTAFFDLLDNLEQVKVLHAARQDLEIFYYLAGRLPQNLYDTQIAASFLGLGEQVAYKTLVQKYCNIDVSKAQQFTDWSRRPLKDEQIEYALSDVTYLAEIYPQILKGLEDKGRLEWVNQDMSDLYDISYYDVDPEDAWMRVKIRSHKPKDLVVLKQLAAWREAQAKSRNVPRGRVLKDEALSQIAMIQPKTEKALSEIRFFGGGRTKSGDAQKIINIVHKALQSPKSEWPQRERKAPLPTQKATALELLKMLIKVIAAENDISVKAIASANDLEDLALLEEEASSTLLKGWRYDIFGKEALALLSGKLSLAYKDGQIIRHELP